MARRYISVYSEIVDGYKRTHVDFMTIADGFTNGVVIDRQCVEGHDYHGRVDEMTKPIIRDMAMVYGVAETNIYDLGVVPSKQFNIEQSK